MAEYNPYAILAAGMPVATQALQTLGAGSVDLAKYQRSQADHEGLRLKLQAERLAEIDRLDRRQATREDEIHSRSRSELTQDRLSAARAAYASEGGDIAKSSAMSMEQLAAETARLKRANIIAGINQMSDAKIRSAARLLGVKGWENQDIGTLSGELANAEIDKSVRDKQYEDRARRTAAVNDPNFIRASSLASGTLSALEAQLARAINPANIQRLTAEQSRRIAADLAESDEIHRALAAVEPNSKNRDARLRHIRQGNYVAATAGLGAEALEPLRAAIRQANDNAYEKYSKQGSMEMAQALAQHNKNIDQAAKNLANGRRAITDTFGQNKVWGDLLLEQVFSNPASQAALYSGAETEQPDEEQAPPSLFPVPVVNPNAQQAAPATFQSTLGNSPNPLLESQRLYNGLSGWNPTGDPTAPPPDLGGFGGNE